MGRSRTVKQADALPPWREVTPDDFLRETYKATLAAEKHLIRARENGQLRLRLILREAKDLKYGAFRDPLWPYDYKYGTHHMLRDVDEVVIETRDGRRHLVERLRATQASPLAAQARP
ncbi:hypothetical protein [Methylobacterium nigriterrae]|uniref:hypothetical protein n=1 Tax=Methylobacterium nigriterrae TaxID=3127512 RepID=UPI0030139296